MKYKKSLYLLAAALLVTGCSEQEVPVYGEDAIVLFCDLCFVVLAVYLKLEFFHIVRPTPNHSRKGEECSVHRGL